mgnify:CR=1 FL=1
MLFSFFENRVPPYPSTEPVPPPPGFFAFVWACTRGMRGWIGLLTLTSALLAVYEAALFAIMGHVVDWLSTVSPAGFWQAQRGTVWGIAAILLSSVLLLGLHTAVMHQVLAINFPMRLRWVFHRLMLGQSMSFYADEFAGRITTKIMQTALSVREVVFMVVDVLVGVSVYMIGILVLAASFEWRLMLPFALWLAAYTAACFYFVPRLGQIGKAQADARSMMTGRVTDAYTNIATVKLFAHTRREAEFARSAMEAFKATGYTQMRLVSQFEIANHLMITLLLLGSTGTALWLWSEGQATAGVVAAVMAMALRLMGYSHWVMWQMTGLFENVGTIQDGILTLTKDTIEETAKERRVDVTVNLFGQELNDKTYALCKSDIIMKGDEAKGIAVGDTLLVDEFRDQKFNFMLANPPYGVDWKREYDSVSAEAEDKSSRFAPGLPDKSDGQLLFTLHMLHKMDPKGSRVGILSNGSPLFNGGAGSGWSNIRKHMLDNDLLDAIIALPGGLFYGTGIATYLWIFDNKKPESHKNKVLLINAAKDEYVQPMRKNLGMKNVLVSDYGRSEIGRIYHAFETCDNAKLMDKDDFFYTYITVERPLRLIYKDVKTKYAALDEKKRSEALANIVALNDIDTERTDAEFFAYLESKKIKTTAKLIKDCRTFFGEVSETAPEVHVIPFDDNSDLVADTNLRDYESIPFKTDIQEYFQNEVLRFAPDAWMDREKDKIGCEFPISKLFYEYQPLRSVEDILADIRALEEDEEQSIQSLIND